MNKLFNWLAMGLAVVILAACAPATPVATDAPATEPPTDEPTEPAVATEPGVQNTIVFGDIGSDPAEIIDGAQPIADYVAKNLETFGITGSEVKVVSTDAEMIDMFTNGEVDLYFDSVYPATLIADGSGAKPFIRRWSRGVGEYHAVLFTTKDSGITTLDDLKGKMLAFDNRYSTSGYMLPLAYLTEQGFVLNEKNSPSDSVAADEIGYAFSDADENTVQWVLNGLVGAGVTDNVRFGRYEDNVKNQLVILAETEDVPRQVGLARADINPELLSAITEILLTMDQNEEGRAALASFADTTKFDEFPDIDKTFDRIREMIELVNEAQNK